MRDPEVILFTRRSSVALIAALTCVASACQHQTAHDETAVATPLAASPAASLRPWQSDETTLDAAGRAIIAQVRSKMPAALRKCVVWTRVPPGKPGYDELPDHGLIVMFHLQHEEPTKDSRPGYSVLYYDRTVHVDTSVVYLPGWDTYLLPTMMVFNYGRVDKNVDYSHCLE